MLRHKFKQRSFIVTLVIIICWSQFSLFAQRNDAPKKQIIAAIQSGADYAVNVLLDENGKSRCEYSILEGKWQDYEPAWHTGQIIFALTRAYEITQNPQYLEAAKKAGDWWLTLEIKDHPKLKGMVRAIHGAGVDYIVFATVTDGTAGLFRLYDLTGDERYAKIPTQAGDWMYANMYEPNSRMFYDAVDPETGEVMKEWSPFWEEKQAQTLNDVARPNNEGSLYKDMFEYTKNEKYKKIFIEICESLVEKQGPEGIWMDFTPNNKAEGYFHPRFNIWYAESLLEGYDLTGDKRYLESALKVGRFYKKFQKKNGVFYYRNFLDGSADKYSISGSTTAFAGILWLRLLRYGVGEEFKENIQKSLKWILENQYAQDHPDKNLAGGFVEIRSKSKKGKLRVINRDVGTSFCVRFLCDYYEYAYLGRM
ncbi:MAG: beta-L-arabinofuranosidase domain-containing protein [bacterium]